MRDGIMRRQTVLIFMVLIVGCDGVQLGVGAGDEMAATGPPVRSGSQGSVQGEGQFQCGVEPSVLIRLGQSGADGFVGLSETGTDVLMLDEPTSGRVEVAIRIEGRVSPLESVAVGLVRKSDGRVMAMGTQYRPVLRCVDNVWVLSNLLVEFEEGLTGLDLSAEQFELVGEFRFLDEALQPSDQTVTYSVEVSG